MHHKIKKFNIRVYGIALNHRNEVLLTDEFRQGMFMTKFPGGGLEFGEGAIDCLKRECREELNQDIEIIRHFYTTDFFQPTYLLKEPQQLVSIYYLIKLENPLLIETADQACELKEIDGTQIFRWVSMKKLITEKLTFPIDKKVAEMLYYHYSTDGPNFFISF
jgi:8-oxo-dGTP diphosphatase